MSKQLMTVLLTVPASDLFTFSRAARFHNITRQAFADAVAHGRIRTVSPPLSRKRYILIDDLWAYRSRYRHPRRQYPILSKPRTGSHGQL